MNDKIRRDQPGVAQNDDLAKDLLDLLSDKGLTEDQVKLIMLQLVPFVVRRDHTVFNHAYQVGRASV
jgi:hypothetical protein